MYLPIEIQALAGWLGTIMIMDCIWVSLLKRYVISNDLRILMLEKVKRSAAIIVRILLTLWCFIFVVLPTSGYELGAVALMGWFWGLLVYGVYEFTNKALLFAWSRSLVFRDIVWWVILCVCVSVVMSSILY